MWLRVPARSLPPLSRWARGAASAGGTHLNGYALTFGAFGDPGDVLEMEMTKRPVQ